MSAKPREHVYYDPVRDRLYVIDDYARAQGFFVHLSIVENNAEGYDVVYDYECTYLGEL